MIFLIQANKQIHFTKRDNAGTFQTRFIWVNLLFVSSK